MKKMFKSVVMVGLCAWLISSLFVSSTYADDKITKGKEPNPADNPVLAGVMKLGTKVYYLGIRGGLDGWLIEKNGQIQIAYAVPGGQDIVLGALFGPNGENVSSAQVQAILDEHPDLKNAMIATATRTPPSPSGLNDSIASIQAATTAAKEEIARMAPPMAGSFVPPTADSLPSVSPAVSPGELLYRELMEAGGTNIGNASAPILIMVMDPTCPHCHDTWEMIRDKVLGNALQVRLVPIARDAKDSEEERAAAQLLHSATPLNTLDRYEAGDKSQLVGNADPVFLDAVRANHRLADRWHMEKTPFLVYRGKDGKVKIIQGTPDQPSALLADLLP